MPKGSGFRSALWTVGGFGTLHLLRFGFNLILTRLLMPEVFGLMALANAIVLGLQTFSDIGIGPSIIQHKRENDTRFLDSAWTLQILRGLLLGLGTCLLAWPMAVFYQTSALIWLLPLLGASAVILGFNSLAIPLLTQRLANKPVMLMKVGTYLGGMVFTLAWVKWVQADVWGFAIGNLVSSVLTLASTYLMLRGPRHRLCWDPAAVREIVHFGKWILLGTVSCFLADSLDRFIIGKLTSLSLLGIYQVGQQLSWVPVHLVMALGGQVLFPLYSRSRQQPGGAQRAANLHHPRVLSCGAVLVSGLIVVGPLFVSCLYGRRYHEAGWMVQVLAIGTWLRMLETTCSAVLLGMGRSRAQGLNHALKFVTMAALMPLGYHFGGLPGLLLGMVASDFIRYLGVLWALQRARVRVFHYDLLLSLAIAGISLAGLLLSRQSWLLAWNKWAQLAILAHFVLLLGLMMVAAACFFSRSPGKKLAVPVP